MQDKNTKLKKKNTTKEQEKYKKLESVYGEKLKVKSNIRVMSAKNQDKVSIFYKVIENK